MVAITAEIAPSRRVRPKPTNIYTPLERRQPSSFLVTHNKELSSINEVNQSTYKNLCLTQGGHVAR